MNSAGSGRHQACQLLIRDMEAELRRIGIWDADPPSPEALDSLAPFSFDTLSFSQWLQWVFIPRTQAVIDGKHILPERSNITPLAEEMLRQIEQDTDHLLTLIEQFDRLIDPSI